MDTILNISKKEKLFFKNNISSIIFCVCGFVSESTAKAYICESKTIHEFFKQIISDIKSKEDSGWNGLDLPEKQLNLLTLVSELYLRKNKSKYKILEKPSEILTFLILLIENSFNKNELKWRQNNEK